MHSGGEINGDLLDDGDTDAETSTVPTLCP
jgi:hypothetical protein